MLLNLPSFQNFLQRCHSPPPPQLPPRILSRKHRILSKSSLRKIKSQRVKTSSSPTRNCLFPFCVNQRQSGGLCKTHGGGSRCTHEGCTKSSQSKGLCRKHGGGKLCSIVGCTRGPQRGGLCHTVRNRT